VDESLTFSGFKSRIPAPQASRGVARGQNPCRQMVQGYIQLETDNQREVDELSGLHCSPSSSWQRSRQRLGTGYHTSEVTMPSFPATSPLPWTRNSDPLGVDAYFSADVETDGPIPGPFSMLSFALVYAGTFDGSSFSRPPALQESFYAELRPISEEWESEALAVNGLDRKRLLAEGRDPASAMTEAASWVRTIAAGRRPILVAYPLSFDWTWLYWYFVKFSGIGSPFNHSGCFDVKTAFAVKAEVPIARAGRDQVHPNLLPDRPHTHHALDDAREQAELFANLFEWRRG
jgi:hypothetical protein